MDTLKNRLDILEKVEMGELTPGEAIEGLRSDCERYLINSEMGYWEQQQMISSLTIRLIRLEDFFVKNYKASLKEMETKSSHKNGCNLIGQPVEIGKPEDINAFIDTFKLN